MKPNRRPDKQSSDSKRKGKNRANKAVVPAAAFRFPTAVDFKDVMREYFKATPENSRKR